MTTFFLDTGYVIALESTKDQHHLKARQHWRNLAKRRPELVTTSYVMAELLAFFNRRGWHAKAVEVGRRLLESPHIQFVHVDIPLFEAGWRYFQQRPDKRYSLTDCISFVVMERQAIREALSFDEHYEQAGFIRLS